MLQTSLKPVEARIYTNEFRVYGVVYMRPGTGTAWMLNTEQRPHVPVTRVSMFRPGIAHPPDSGQLAYESHFAAVPKASIVWMQGGAPDSVQEGLGKERRGVYLVYPSFVIAGSFLIRPELRLSDYLATAMGPKPFATLHDARILSPQGREQRFGELPVVQQHDFVTVNLHHVGVVFDERGGDPAKAYVAEG
ncbi:MAG: hypothetical protein P1P87_14400 [Trueperaceae bacterium]|nr:hypothetical protein [Trueperaceae bacterium]